MPHTYDLVVVGMGSAGMVAAEFAATLGLRVAAVEHRRPGGDCLWTGCVPSKALIASARAAQGMRAAGRLGIGAVEPDIDTAAVWARMRAVREAIAATDDSPARFGAMGVELVAGRARLTGPHDVEAGGRTLDTRFILLCTGSRPAIPPIDGLAAASPLTTETLFERERAPRSLLIVGAGPVGVEMAQAHRRLGVRVTLLEREPRILPRDEPELTERLAGLLRDEGVDLHLGAVLRGVTVETGEAVVSGTVGGRPERWAAAEVLVAAGRRPDVEGLGLDAVGVATGPGGVTVDRGMRTSVPSIYACGDVVGGDLFTHAAGHQAATAVRDMFFPGRARPRGPMPWCTFTDPELAHAGVTAAEARATHGARSVEVVRHDLEHSDRARTDAVSAGAIVLVAARGRLVGAHVLAPGAGEIIGGLTLAIQRRMRLSELAGAVQVYPTIGTGIGLVTAGAAFARARRLRRLLRL